MENETNKANCLFKLLWDKQTSCILLHVEAVDIKPVIFVLGNQRYHSHSSAESYDLILIG